MTGSKRRQANETEVQKIVREIKRLYDSPSSPENDRQIIDLSSKLISLYFLQNDIPVTRTTVKKMLTPSNVSKIAKDLSIFPAPVQIGLDNLLPSRPLNTILKEIESLEQKRTERIKAGRTGGGAGAFNRDVDAISHKIDLLNQELKKSYPEHTAPPKQQQPSFTPEPTCQPGVMGNYGGKPTFDYVLSEIRKAGASVRYQTKKSGSQTIYWAIETPDKYQNGESLRIDVFNGAKEGAIRITTDKKALRFTCTQARQAVVSFLEAYQELQNSTESIAGKAQAIHKKIAAQIGANGLIVKP